MTPVTGVAWVRKVIARHITAKFARDTSKVPEVSGKHEFSLFFVELLVLTYVYTHTHTHTGTHETETVVGKMRK